MESDRQPRQIPMLRRGISDDLPPLYRDGLNGDARPKPTAAAPAMIRVLPMELKIGDCLVDETGEWEAVGRLYTTAGGKTARVRVQRVGEPRNHHLRTWAAHERVTVRRA